MTNETKPEVGADAARAEAGPRADPAAFPHSAFPADAFRLQPAMTGGGSGAAYTGYATGGGGGESPLRGYLRILVKRRWTAGTTFLITVVLVTIYAFTTTPIYEARVQIHIEPAAPNVTNFQDVLQQAQGASDYYQTQYRLLESRALARRTLDSEGWWVEPLFAGTAPRPGFSLNPLRWVAAATDLAASVGSRRPAQAPDPDETLAQSRAIDRFLARLTIAPVRNSQLVEVVYAAPDPAVAARAANALSRAYIEQSLDFRFTATREATDFLDERIAEQRKALENSQLALQRYREQTDSVSLEDRQNIVVQRLADLNSAVTRARTERIQKESVYQQVRAIQDNRTAMDSVPAVLGNAYIQQLKAQVAELQRQRAQSADKLGERHPDMVRLQTAIDATDAKIQAEIARVVQALRNDFDAAVAEERSLTVALDQQKVEAQELNRQTSQYGVLQRDATANQQVFDTLLQRSKETEISGESRASNIRIVDPAETPRSPARPNKANALLFALLGGGLLGAGLAFFFEYLDNRIKSPEEIKDYLGLPFLGLVPAVASKDYAGIAPLVHNRVPHGFAEAFRMIRTNVIFSSADEGSRSVAITSTGPSEGKTLVSSNLAIALAMAGQRVLLIDADMRRPKLHETFAVPLEPGLSNAIVGNAKPSESVRGTAVPNLWILSAGKTPPNPAELLGSRRFKDFLGSLTQHFEWVLLDSPPVMAVTDAAVVANLTSGVLFVVGAEMTARAAARVALEQLDAAKARHVGAVLNRVDLQRDSYYYSQYYRREYAAYQQVG